MNKVLANDSPLTAHQVEQLASGKCEATLTYCNRRNTVIKVKVGDKWYVVKYFKKPNIINRLVYGTLRKSKARRAMEWSERLLGCGFLCPRPVAFTEDKNGLLFTASCFISEYFDRPTLKRYLINNGDRWEDGRLCTLPPQKRHRLMTDLAKFVFDLHSKGIVPGDMNWENIFVLEPDVKDIPDKKAVPGSEGLKFALTDVNRTQRLKPGRLPDIRTSMKAFGQMFADPTLQAEIAPLYAALRGFEPDEALIASLEARVKRRKKRARIRCFLHPFSRKR